MATRKQAHIAPMITLHITANNQGDKEEIQLNSSSNNHFQAFALSQSSYIPLRKVHMFSTCFGLPVVSAVFFQSSDVWSSENVVGRVMLAR